MNLTKVEFDNESDQLISKKEEKVYWKCKKFPSVTSEVQELCPLDGSMMISSKSAIGVVAKIKLRKAQMNHFYPEYYPVSKIKMNRKIRLLGSVMQSEEKESNITARAGGRVEKVYVKSTGSMVKQGDLVLEIYSPQMITAGEEYLLTKKDKTDVYKELNKQSEERLILWGIKKGQLEKWYKEGKVPRKIKIYSNTTGIVRKMNASVGKYFKEGQNFFELSDFSEVWVELDVYENDSSLIEIGQKVELEFTALPGEKITGIIDFVRPFLDKKTRTLKIRTTIKNSLGKLRPGMIADAVLTVQNNDEIIAVPRSAIIDTGKRKVVWLRQTDKQFQAIKVETGLESEGYIEIKKGLDIGDEIVLEGNFLLDAQAQLFGGYEDIGQAQSSNHRH